MSCMACYAFNPGCYPSEFVEPSTPIVTWEVEVSKGNNGMLGLQIVPEDNVLRVAWLESKGGVSDFNSANKTDAVEVGDFIISVNGVKGTAREMLEEAQRAASLKLTLSRSRMFRAKFYKNGPLGVTFGLFARTLVVQNIADGPVKEWNDANVLYTIQPGDLVIEVNGVKENSKEMLETLKVDGDLRLVMRPLGGAGF
mmetsp:Transcript_87403/g.168223  ORF Transcript_87403/g.168223 Transcript_87403/m.168223 type:complete len:198 (+) Transcript_87403:104-697(+)